MYPADCHNQADDSELADFYPTFNESTTGHATWEVYQDLSDECVVAMTASHNVGAHAIPSECINVAADIRAMLEKLETLQGSPTKSDTARVVDKVSKNCVDAIIALTGARSFIPGQCLDSKEDIKEVLFLLGRIGTNSPTDDDLSVFSTPCQEAVRADLAVEVEEEDNTPPVENPLVPCNDDFCNGRGVANDTLDGCKCDCVGGFTGDRCEESADIIKESSPSGVASFSWFALLAAVATFYTAA
jgi:hypothetical protein